MLDLCHFSKNFYAQLVNQQYMVSAATRNTHNLQIESSIYLCILIFELKMELVWCMYKTKITDSLSRNLTNIMYMYW